VRPLACLVVATLLLPLAAAQTTEAAPSSDPCPEQRSHLTAYHFLVNNTTHEHLAGVVHAGDEVTIAFSLAACDGTTRDGEVLLVLPTCSSPVRTVALHALEGLDDSNETNEVERALVRDVEAGMACKAELMDARIAALTPLTIGALVALAGAVVAIRRSRRGK